MYQHRAFTPLHALALPLLHWPHLYLQPLKLPLPAVPHLLDAPGPARATALSAHPHREHHATPHEVQGYKHTPVMILVSDANRGLKPDSVNHHLLMMPSLLTQTGFVCVTSTPCHGVVLNVNTISLSPATIIHSSPASLATNSFTVDVSQTLAL